MANPNSYTTPPKAPRPSLQRRNATGVPIQQTPEEARVAHAAAPSASRIGMAVASPALPAFASSGATSVGPATPSGGYRKRRTYRKKRTLRKQRKQRKQKTRR